MSLCKKHKCMMYACARCAEEAVQASLTSLEDLFLRMYELGSADSTIEEQVEQTLARIVKRQNEDRNPDPV